MENCSPRAQLTPVSPPPWQFSLLCKQLAFNTVGRTEEQAQANCKLSTDFTDP